MKAKAFLFTAIFIMAACSSNTDRQISPIGKACPEVRNGAFTAEILNTLGRVSDPQVSPDGERILYGVTYTDIAQNRRNTELFVMNSDGSENRRITTTSCSESNARWIDSGRRIAFLSEGRIWVMEADGSGRRCISRSDVRISEFKFSPDGSKVLYVSAFKVARKAADIYPDIPESTARTINGLMYRHWDHFVEEIPHTYVADFDGRTLSEGKDILNGEPFELPTEPFGGLEQVAWSPEGGQIAYSCRKLTGIDYAFSTNTDIYLHNLSSGAEWNVTEGMPGYDTDPVFSPDGRYVAWLSMARGGYEADKSRLFIAETVSGEIRELTTGFKYNVSSPAWAPDSKSIYFSSLVEGLGGIWNIDLEGSFHQVSPQGEWYDFGAPVVLSDRIITTNASMMRPSEIVSVDLADGSWKQLTTENDDILAQLDQCRMEDRWITTTDGKKMLTWVIYPPHFDASKKYPAILICLGGPQGAITQEWSYRWNYRLMAARGYIVVLPNRRGTTAFGQEWCEQISGDYCGQNIQDYLSAAKALKAEPYVGKMAAAGASYGGYSVYYLAGMHNNTFDCFVAHAGIFNQEHMYMETEEMWFPNWDNGGIAMSDVPQSGAPWSDNPVARRHYANSPHKLVKNWNTPILVIHGEKDYRVPVDQGMAAFNAAQMMGVPSQMLLFPDENHWVLKPQNSIHWHRVYFEWLDRWLKE